MLIFSMHRYRILGVYQRVDQLYIFPAGMTGHMNILENNICTLTHQLVDNAGNRFFVSRNRIGTENNGIVGLDTHFPVGSVCHAGKCSHRLSLTSCCNNNCLLVRITAKRIYINQNIIGQGQITEFRSNFDDIHHASSLNCNFTPKFVCRIYNLLYTVHI